ncbi:MAG TPA: NAD(P)-dependent oxidoreductase [Planctomycetaceae bacterium]
MKIAVTGATGFLGRYFVERFIADRHTLRCWYRPSSDRGGFEGVAERIEWVEGSLRDPESGVRLVAGCDAVVHAALDRPGEGFRGAEGDVVEFAETNVIGTLRLIEAARAAGVGRFVFVSTCAVHEKILPDRPLDETHPTWSTHHYGAHKAAIEQFVYSYGLGDGYSICALRPCGIYGVARPAEASKWFDLVRRVVRGETVECRRGGKEVHAADVAHAAALLLTAPAEKVAGQAFNCCDRYVSEHEVATLAAEFSGSGATVRGERTRPKNVIESGKLRSLGMTFGGEDQLRETVRRLVEAARG